MPYTSQQHLAARFASAHGYKIQEQIALSEFSVGEGIIVLNKKGEPMMSGQIEDMTTEGDGRMGVKVGDLWYHEANCIFRRL